MKKLLLSTLLVFFATLSLSAHNLWIETNPKGTLGETQQVQVYYGEYSYDYYEKVSGHFQDVKDFDLWVISPSGAKMRLSTKAEEKSYKASFTPEENGVYTLVLSSTKAEVVDWTEYNLGVLKPNFYASKTVVVGNNSSSKAKPAKEASTLFIQDVNHSAYTTNDTADVKVIFEGEPVAEQEITVSVSNQWSKTITTDKNGVAQLALPWKGQYILEAVYTEEAPGQYNGTDYEAIRHTATYTIQAK